MSNGILIFAEVTRDNYIHTVFFELVNKARELSKKLDGQPIMAVIFSKPDLVKEFQEGFTNTGIDKVFVYEDNAFENYSTQTYANLITELVKEIDPAIFLIGATNQGRDLAPRISSALQTGLTADCIELDINEKGQLAATRPTFGGQLMATILCKTFPQMATVREGVMKKEVYNQNHKGEVNRLDVSKYVEDSDFCIEILERHIEQQKVNIKGAQIIVCGGYGMASKPDGFKLLHELAETLGGEVGATRAAVDAGMTEHERQVGQTGVTVRPKLYIGCGVSGAVQHRAGMQESSKIISINTDVNAPLNSIADYTITGDAFEIIPKLIKYYKKNSK